MLESDYPGLQTYPQYNYQNGTAAWENLPFNHDGTETSELSKYDIGSHNLL